MKIFRLGLGLVKMCSLGSDSAWSLTFVYTRVISILLICTSTLNEVYEMLLTKIYFDDGDGID